MKPLQLLFIGLMVVAYSCVKNSVYDADEIVVSIDATNWEKFPDVEKLFIAADIFESNFGITDFPVTYYCNMTERITLASSK